MIFGKTKALPVGVLVATSVLCACGDVTTDLVRVPKGVGGDAGPPSAGQGPGGSGGGGGAQETGGLGAAGGVAGSGAEATSGGTGSWGGGGQCQQSADCLALCTSGECDRDLCDPLRGRCVECVQDGHCDDVGEICSTSIGKCGVPCLTGADCPRDDPVCDAVVGICVECVTDADCSEDENERCRGSECIGGFP